MDVSAADKWKELQFSELQNQLDKQCQEITESQQASTESRRALTGQTKAFRKFSNEEKLSNVRGLLKSYQTEIDALTKRCKNTETGFMDVYKKLALLPDPAPLIAKIHTSDQPKQDEDDSLLARQLERQIKLNAQLERQVKQLQEQQANTTVEIDSPTDLSTQIDELETQLAAERAEKAELQSQARENAGLLKKQLSEISELKTQSQSQSKPQSGSGSGAAKVESEQSESSKQGNTSAEAKLRRRNQELEAKYLDLEQEVSQLRREKDANKQLLRRLEDDLQKSEVASQATGWTGFSKVTQAGKQTSAPEILTSQRDRYKTRAQENEEKAHKLEVETQTLSKELKEVKQEREKLFTQLRQLQPQPQSKSGNASSTSSGNVGSVYAPAAQNLLKELDLERRVEGLNSIDAFLLKFGAQQVVSPKSRKIAAAYAILVHLALCGALVL